MTSTPITEADTCRKYVLPRLYEAGWTDDQISEQKSITDGRIVVLENRCRRRQQNATIDFSEPFQTLRKNDRRELRRRILCLSQSEARKLGIGRSTLHYLRKNARSHPSFKIYGRVFDRLARQ